MSESGILTVDAGDAGTGNDLKVEIIQTFPVTVVRVTGDVVIGTDPLLRSVFETAMGAGAPAMEVDLAGARLFDSHGLVVLEEVCTSVLGRGRSLVLRGIRASAGYARADRGGSPEGIDLVGVQAGAAR